MTRGGSPTRWVETTSPPVPGAAENAEQESVGWWWSKVCPNPGGLWTAAAAPCAPRTPPDDAHK